MTIKKIFATYKCDNEKCLHEWVPRRNIRIPTCPVCRHGVSTVVTENTIPPNINTYKILLMRFKNDQLYEIRDHIDLLLESRKRLIDEGRGVILGDDGKRNLRQIAAIDGDDPETTMGLGATL